MMKTTLIALAALVAAPSAFAIDNLPPQITVEFSVQELQSEAGLAAISERVENQAREACIATASTRVADHADQTCVADIVGAANALIASERAAL